MASAGKIATGAAGGAAMGAPLGPWGIAGGALIGGIWSALGGDGDNEAPAPPPSQYGGNPLTNQLAAQQYAAGLQQQQAQNAREAAFYGNAQGNFDVANAAQGRESAQIASSAADRQRQIAALGGTNAAIGNVNQTGQQLTALGTRPMGPSYAEAQLRQGQDAAMAQQLSMARSGRSLGSGQASMQQAAFNNAALNQQTNLAAANARIQEQNAYNQFQAGALGAAGQQYGAAGALSGQAGNQATGIRQGNENVQLQNAQLQQAQQGINNQTTGLYNQLGAQQQGFGMQANSQGQNAFQFGANQASGMQGAQLNADTGRLSSATATNIANQGNANAHDAATMNMLASGAAAASDAVGNANASAAPTNANNPSGSTSPYQSITKESNIAGQNTQDRRSDENQKKNITPMKPKPGGLTSPTTDAKNAAKYAGFSPEDAAAYRAADEAAARGDSTYTANGKTNELHPYGDAPMDPDTNKIAVQDAPPPASSTYAETIAALNAAYRPSQMAPTDVLNHVPGAGAPHSASQDAAIAAMQRAPQGAGRMTKIDPGYTALPAGLTRGNAPMSSAATSMIGHEGNSVATGLQAPGGSGRTLGTGKVGASVTPYTPRPAAPVAAPPAWGDVFNQPALDPRIQAYLNGASPYAAPAPAAPAPRDFDRGTLPGPTYLEGGGYNAPPGVNNLPGMRSSDVHSKTRIRELEGQLAALGGPSMASFAPQQPDTASLDASEEGRQVRGNWRQRDPLDGPSSYPHPWDADPFATKSPAIDLRPAQGYSYEYKQPGPGAPPGRHVGPMAQDLEHTAAAGTVHNSPHGKVVDTQGLTMVNTAALSEQQRKTEELERQLAAIQSAQTPRFDPGIYPATRAPY